METATRPKTPFEIVGAIACVVFANLAAIGQYPVLGTGAFLCLTIMSIFMKAWNILPVSLLFCLLNTYWIVAPTILKNLPALPFLIPFLITIGLLFLFKYPESSVVWLKKGNIDLPSIILVTLTGITSTAALIIWGFWTNNLGVGLNMGKAFLAYPLWSVLALAIPTFALVNAFAEEVVYRGILQEALGNTFSMPSVVFLLQGSAFAAVHFSSGFPNGVVGYAMVLIYGLMLGFLRWRTKGILAPYVAHVIADLCIGYFLILYLVNSGQMLH